MVKVAVNERIGSVIEALVKSPYAVVGVRVIQPRRDEVVDGAKRRAGGHPELTCNAERDADAVAPRQRRKIVSRLCALDERRAPFAIMSQHTNSATTVPVCQRVDIVIGLPVIRAANLEHGAIADGGDVRPRRASESSAEREAPLQRDLVSERFEHGPAYGTEIPTYFPRSHSRP